MDIALREVVKGKTSSDQIACKIETTIFAMTNIWYENWFETSGRCCSIIVAERLRTVGWVQLYHHPSICESKKGAQPRSLFFELNILPSPFNISYDARPVHSDFVRGLSLIRYSLRELTSLPTRQRIRMPQFGARCALSGQRGKISASQALQISASATAGFRAGICHGNFKDWLMQVFLPPIASQFSRYGVL